ncbi:DUF4062 domain-containing protein [Enterobacter bugandensis]|uniref:DUF4062 domain-containing protein n=1 Tax=Enterobacter bugandensis TaxID=881260 RepID=UPI002005EF7F|nr:DUF4062 domain-containing protein [Enterobacter bugandensis]MCK6853438.1 DUF4062 domain-containing protein [Enterobacter bugandensis]
MEEKKYQIFVSSTYLDLFEARKKVIETVLSLYHFPVGMEMFSADDSEQWEIIKETIEGSDYYVIIIGQKYGSISDKGLSYTEMEYDYAKSLGIPVLAFIRNPDVDTKPHERERDQSKIEKLELFIEKAKANKMCDFWNSIDDLAAKVAIALPKIMRRIPRIGWVRGDQATSKEISTELAELSTENRSLREKVRAYESLVLADAPILELSMIDNDLELSIPTNTMAKPYFEKLSIIDVPEAYRGEVTEDTLQKYNANLPSDEKIDSYNKKLFLHTCYKESSLKFSPVLKNVGKKIATDVYIHIDLPEFVVALDDENEKIFTESPSINIPATPMEVIDRQRAARERISFIRGKLVVEGGGVNEKEVIDESEIKFSRVYDNSLLAHMAKIRPLNANDWIDYEKNRIVLRVKRLIQSLSIDFDDVTLIPIRKGEGVISFKIICEELKEPVTFIRKIKVL